MDQSTRNDFRLLSLDGGGVRGLSSLYLLKQTMENAGQEDRKPCEVFDMIGGTSTGGLIAIMLGHLEMSIRECLDAYYLMMKDVFTKKRPRVNLMGQVKGRYDTEALEAAIKRVILASGAPENQLFRTRPRSGCRVVVCASSLQNSRNAVRFTNYPIPGEANSDFYNECRTWEVARATSAAPTYFDPIDIGRNKRRFGDGAFHYNNPIEEVWRSAIEIWDHGSVVSFEDRVISCLSLGTGVPAVKKMGKTPIALMRSLKEISLETEETAKRFQNTHPRFTREENYLRLNVEQGLQYVGLAETEECSMIEDATEAYGNLPAIRNLIVKFCQTLPSILDSQQLIRMDDNKSPTTRVLEAVFAASPEREINPRARYWLHMNENDMDLFQTAHEYMPHNTDGSIPWHVLRDQFALLDAKCPSTFTLYDVCSRLRKQPGTHSPLSKQHFLAVLYMLRVEHCFRVHPPLTPDGRFAISHDRKLAIEQIDKWVVCVCNCQRRWNFINNRGLISFLPSSRPERPCEALRYVQERNPSSVAKRLYVANQAAWANA